MKRTLLWMLGIVLLLAAPATSLHAQDKDITGNWQGTLQAGKGLRTLIKISKDDGKLKAVMYSIDQGGQPIPLTSISVEGSTINFAISPLDVTYTGTLNPEGNSISGNATQNGHTNVLNLEPHPFTGIRVVSDAAWGRQPPERLLALTVRWHADRNA